LLRDQEFKSLQKVSKSRGVVAQQEYKQLVSKPTVMFTDRIGKDNISRVIVDAVMCLDRFVGGCMKLSIVKVEDGVSLCHFIE
jgi:hypothetical protein